MLSLPANKVRTRKQRVTNLLQLTSISLIARKVTIECQTAEESLASSSQYIVELLSCESHGRNHHWKQLGPTIGMMHEKTLTHAALRKLCASVLAVDGTSGPSSKNCHKVSAQSARDLFVTRLRVAEREF